MPDSVAMLSIHTSPLDTPGRTKDAGGMNVYMRQLAQELAQTAINIDIFTRWTDERTPQIVPLNSHVRVIHIKAGPRSPIHKNDLHRYIPAFARNIEEFRCGEGRNYDIIHSHYWLSSIAAMQLACSWDVPHVTMFHTLGRLKQEANPREQEPALRLEMEQRLIQHADRIIAATADERVQMIRCCGARASQVEVIPCGVDLKPTSSRLRSPIGSRLTQPPDGERVGFGSVFRASSMLQAGFRTGPMIRRFDPSSCMKSVTFSETSTSAVPS